MTLTSFGVRLIEAPAFFCVYRQSDSLSAVWRKLSNIIPDVMRRRSRWGPWSSPLVSNIRQTWQLTGQLHQTQQLQCERQSNRISQWKLCQKIFVDLFVTENWIIKSNFGNKLWLKYRTIRCWLLSLILLQFLEEKSKIFMELNHL